MKIRLFAWFLIGAAAGEVVGMVFCQPFPGKTDIEVMLILVAGGGSAGVYLGSRCRTDKSGVLLVILLCTGIGAVCGWLPGEHHAYRQRWTGDPTPSEEQIVPIIRRWIGIGAAAGLATGLLLAPLQLLLEKRLPKGEPEERRDSLEKED